MTDLPHNDLQDRPATGIPGGGTVQSEAKGDPCDAAALRTALGGPGEPGEHEGPGAADRAPFALFRIYEPGVDPFDEEGYPLAWKVVKHAVRALDGHRCLRCRHPFVVGATPGKWSPCDRQCRHANGPDSKGQPTGRLTSKGWEARWRVLTVHHLNGVKGDLRWHNLVSLCQRCHLLIQRKVVMDRPWPWPHTDWFQPYAAAFYSVKYLGVEIGRDELTPLVLHTLLALGQKREAEERMPV